MEISLPLTFNLSIIVSLSYYQPGHELKAFQIADLGLRRDHKGAPVGRKPPVPPFLKNTHDLIDRLCQERRVNTHLFAVIGFGVKESAEFLIRRFPPLAHHAVDLKDLFGIGVIEPDVAVVADVDKEIGIKRIDFLIAVTIPLLLETENNSGLKDVLFCFLK